MKSFEDNTHAFVVRVWLEPREIEDAPPEWRGVIEHVSSGERRYLKDMGDMAVFVSSHLQCSQGRFGRWRTLWRWLRRLKLSFVP